MIGRKVIANYGAMYPLESGMVFQVHWGGKSVAIEWESGETSFVPIAKIKTSVASLGSIKTLEEASPSVVSPIGIFWEE